MGKAAADKKNCVTMGDVTEAEIDMLLNRSHFSVHYSAGRGGKVKE